MGIDWDIEELAYRVSGKTEDETEEAINNGDIDEFICERYEIDFDTYCKIVTDLVPFTNPWQSPLSKDIYRGFVDGNRAIVKIKAETKKEV